MSARDDLIEHFASVLYENHDVLAEWHYVTTEDAEEFRGIAAKKVDAVLHEAAESLRGFVGPEAIPGESDTVVCYVRGWHHAAQHIDPEVTP